MTEMFGKEQISKFEKCLRILNSRQQIRARLWESLRGSPGRTGFIFFSVVPNYQRQEKKEVGWVVRAVFQGDDSGGCHTQVKCQPSELSTLPLASSLMNFSHILIHQHMCHISRFTAFALIIPSAWNALPSYSHMAHSTYSCLFCSITFSMR